MGAAGLVEEKERVEEEIKGMLEQARKLNDTYAILEELGRGGGGIVYKAYHERLQTEVVVKQVKDAVKGKLDGRGEADVLKKLKHPYLPRVYDFLELDGEIYTVMDYIPGDNFGNVLKRSHSFPQKEVLKWAKQLAEALEYLHSQNPPVIHSDIKPDNIMLTPDGNICLIDFNISLAFDPSMRKSTGVSKGYSPPEQYNSRIYYESAGEKQAELQETVTMTGGAAAIAEEATAMMDVADATETVTAFAENGGRTISGTDTVSVINTMLGQGIDERSDIYSLGATLYHMLTGIKPGVNFELIRPLSQCGVSVSKGFCHVIEKMMAILPEDRYQNGGELLRALQHSYEEDPAYIAYRRKKRSRTAALAGLYILAGALCASGAVTLNWERNTAYNRAVEEAGSLIGAGDYEGAGAKIAAALKKMPEKIDAYGKELLRLYSMGDYDGCISYGKDIINNPAYILDQERDAAAAGDIWYVLGNAYFEKEDYANASACFSRALEYNRNNSSYYRDYAVVLAKMGNTESAETTLKTAVSMGLAQDSVYFVMGEIAYSKGEYENALELLEKTMGLTTSEQTGRRCVLLCTKACQRLGNGWIDEEIRLLEQAQSGSAAAAGIQITEQLGDAYARKAKSDPENAGLYYQKAADQFLSLMDQGYASFQVMENLAILYQQNDRLEEAEGILTQMAEKYPDNYIVYKRWAFLEADRQQKKANGERDYHAMREYYNQAVSLYEGGGKDMADAEMDMLGAMMADLESGGWF